MRDRDYYPSGAYEDASAPYNQVDPPEKEFNLTVSQTLSKSVEIVTDNYIPEVDYETGHVYVNTSETNWREVYEERGHTPLQLIQLFKRYLQNMLDDKVTVSKSPSCINLLIEECDNWVEDDCEIIED